MTASPAIRRVAYATAAFALLALAVLLARPAPSLAATTSACATRAKQHVHACAGRHRSVHAHTKAKGHHAKRNHSKKKTKARRKSAHAPAVVLRPATCEDGTTPKRGAEGEFSCSDGSAPGCASDVEPVTARSGARPLCPTKANPGSEFSEASCADGSSPERSAGSDAYACEDASRPSCEDGTQPTLSDDGSMLVCITHSSGSPTPPAEEAEAAEEEDNEGDARRASA